MRKCTADAPYTAEEAANGITVGHEDVETYSDDDIVHKYRCKHCLSEWWEDKETGKISFIDIHPESINKGSARRDEEMAGFTVVDRLMQLDRDMKESGLPEPQRLEFLKVAIRSLPPELAMAAKEEIDRQWPGIGDISNEDECDDCGDECECAMCSGMDYGAIMESARENIERTGLHLTGVLVGLNGDLPFIYSAGFKYQDEHPDIILSGIGSEAGMVTINNVFYLLKEKGKRFQDGDISHDVLEGLPVAFRTVTDEHKEDKINFTASIYDMPNKDIEVLQLVWPDPNGKFPWDEGFDNNWKDKQEQLWAT